jgi:hypothetical protein
MTKTKINLDICVLLFIITLTSCTNKQQKDEKITGKGDSIAVSGKATILRNDSITQVQLPSPPAWYFYPDEQELAIADRLPAPKIYQITNGEGSNPLILSGVNAKRDNTLINIDGRPAVIYQGTTALIEGQKISLLHAANFKGSAVGQYTITDYNSVSGGVSGIWKIDSDKQPSLIADLKTARHFRIRIISIDPPPQGAKYRFSIIVDDKVLPLELVNTTSVDTYGSKIGVILKSNPETPDKHFKVNGIFQSW